MEIVIKAKQRNNMQQVSVEIDDQNVIVFNCRLSVWVPRIRQSSTSLLQVFVETDT